MNSKLKIHCHPDAATLAASVAEHAASLIWRLGREHSEFAVIFATGVSQIPLLEDLTSRRDLPWDRVIAFHLDEYAGLPASHPASFRHYLQTQLADKVPLKAFHALRGDAEDLDAESQRYTMLLEQHAPSFCFLGIGENGHIAFNDPHDADFDEPRYVKIVELAEMSRTQQVAEGWFANLDEVPTQALTLTIPAIMRVPELIVSAPKARKRAIVERTLNDPISPECPSTILRTHPNAHLFVDADSMPGCRT